MRLFLGETVYIHFLLKILQVGIVKYLVNTILNHFASQKSLKDCHWSAWHILSKKATDVTFEK